VPNELGDPSPPKVPGLVVPFHIEEPSDAVAFIAAPVVPPLPIVTTVVAAGVVEIVDVPVTEPLEIEAEDPLTRTSPAPPPPPRFPNPPPPPPPTTATSIPVIPVGVVQTQLPAPVILSVVYPLAEVVAIVQAIGLHFANKVNPEVIVTC
jgi:hypothetical protein